MYQLSNQVTLGLSEMAAIKNLKDISAQLISQERTARAELKSNLTVQDEIHRSFGLLKNCRLLDVNEFMNLISNLRLGVAIKELRGPSFGEHNDIMFRAQKAAIFDASGKESLSVTEQNKLRADLVRDFLEKF